MAEAHEFTGKSVDEAISEGLLKLKTTRDQVEIEVLQQGSRGIFGLGGEPARVRLTKRIAPISEPPSSTSGETTSRAEAEPPTKSAHSEAVDSKDIDDQAVGKEPLAKSGSPKVNVARSAAATAATAATASEPELVKLATDLLREIVELMQFVGATVEAEWQEPEDELDERYLLLKIEGDDEELNSLIGRRSETLDALQYLLRLMINQRTRQWQNIVVDVNGYKERRAEQLTKIAIRMAEQAISTGRTQSLEPMPPNERRIVHLALRDYKGVYTESSGEGERRKVHISPQG